jgi:hypothetical protein
MCLWWLCPRRQGNDENMEETNNKTTALVSVMMTPEEIKEYEDVQYMSKKRDIKVTIHKGTQAGVAAGLSVMAGVIVAGPLGAAVGGAIGTALAVKLSKDVVPLNELLEQTPHEKRGEILTIFRDSFKEEFMDTINGSPELKLLLSGASIFGVVRYMMDR